MGFLDLLSQANTGMHITTKCTCRAWKEIFFNQKQFSKRENNPLKENTVSQITHEHFKRKNDRHKSPNLRSKLKFFLWETGGKNDLPRLLDQEELAL